jgi:hypothetical protein
VSYDVSCRLLGRLGRLDAGDGGGVVRGVEHGGAGHQRVGPRVNHRIVAAHKLDPFESKGLKLGDHVSGPRVETRRFQVETRRFQVETRGFKLKSGTFKLWVNWIQLAAQPHLIRVGGGHAAVHLDVAAQVDPFESSFSAYLTHLKA